MSTKTKRVPTPEEERLLKIIDAVERRSAEAEEEVKSLNLRLSDARSDRDKQIGIGNQWRDRAKALETEVGTLRDELHSATVECARLEGYIDRAREFDPKPEEKMITVPESAIRAPEFHRQPFDGLDVYGSATKARKTPWYRRDI